MRIAILPGSYDPMTVGHLGIAESASKQYDKIYIAVMINPDKKYMFNMEQRVRIAQATVEHIKNAEVISDGGLLTDLYKRLGACAVVKGIRNDEDRKYEDKMAEYNRAAEPTFNTVYIQTAPEYRNISSTYARKLLTEGKSTDGVLTPQALKIIMSML